MSLLVLQPKLLFEIVCNIKILFIGGPITSTILDISVIFIDMEKLYLQKFNSTKGVAISNNIFLGGRFSEISRSPLFIYTEYCSLCFPSRIADV